MINPAAIQKAAALAKSLAFPAGPFLSLLHRTISHATVQSVPKAPTINMVIWTLVSHRRSLALTNS
jgi:hypothetical protein